MCLQPCNISSQKRRILSEPQVRKEKLELVDFAVSHLGVKWPPQGNPCDQFVPRSCPLTGLSSSIHPRLYLNGYMWVGEWMRKGLQCLGFCKKKKIEKKNFKSCKLKKSGQILRVCYLILKVIAKNHWNIIEKEPFDWCLFHGVLHLYSLPYKNRAN